MTEMNLLHTELSFEVQETSIVKSSAVHIGQKVKEVKDMTMLCQKKVKKIKKKYNIRTCAICVAFTALL